jgi:endonuclease/exonuclease/phosphatase family metal-dependent hydrolase
MVTSRSSVDGGSALMALRAVASLLGALLISLFFLEALRLYFSQLYLVVWAALFSEPVDVGGLGVAFLMFLSLLSPLSLPLWTRIAEARRIAMLAAMGVSLARLFLSAALPFQVEVIASCVTIALYGLFLPSCFEGCGPVRGSQATNGFLVAGLGLAFAYDMAIRALGTTVDLSLQGVWLPIQLALSALAIAAAYWLGSRTTAKPLGRDLPALAPWAGALVISALGPLLFLEFSLFMHASTVARWVDVDYDLMSVLLPAATGIGLLFPRVKGLWSLHSVTVQNLLILLSVVAFLTWDGWIAGSLILVGQACMMLDLRLLFKCVVSRSYRWKLSTVLGVGLSAGLFMAFILTFLLTLSFAYAYTLDLFRGTEPVSYVVAAVFLGSCAPWAALQASGNPVGKDQVPWVRPLLAALPVMLALIGFALQPRVNPQPADPRRLTIMTYNIHQGFGMDNRLDLWETADAVRQADPDILGLQEADAGRVPSMSIDEVLWLSRTLNMYSAYGPSWDSSYGVAVLSKYPIIQETRHLLTSAKQQRSCLEASVDLGARTLTFYSAHLGLDSDERERQLDEVLSHTLNAEAPKIIVGDFNANPDSHEIGRVLQQFDNAFELGGTGHGYTSPADAPVETIDYVFVSRGIQVTSAEVVDSLASDHLPVAAQVQLR